MLLPEVEPQKYGPKVPTPPPRKRQGKETLLISTREGVCVCSGSGSDAAALCIGVGVSELRKSLRAKNQGWRWKDDAKIVDAFAGKKGGGGAGKDEIFVCRHRFN